MDDLLIVIGYWFGIWLVIASTSFVSTYFSRSLRTGVVVGRATTVLLFSVTAYFIATDPTPGSGELPTTIVCMVLALLLSVCAAEFLPRLALLVVLPVAAQRMPNEEEPSNTVNSQVNETTKDK